MSCMTGIVHKLMTFILDMCRLNHTGKLWKKHSPITVNVRSSIKTIILVSKSLEKKSLRIWSHLLRKLIVFSWINPLPIGISDAFCRGKYKPHPVKEGNNFHFLMNSMQVYSNSSWSHCKFFLKLFKQFIIVKCTCIFCWH